MLCFGNMRSKHRRSVHLQGNKGAPEINIRQLRRFSLHELEVATDNFNEENVLDNRYSKVYKGRLADASLVAIKRPKRRYTQGSELQLQTEVEMIGIALHPNILRLLGFCITPRGRLLVYPLMVNGSVASWLRDQSESQLLLDWPMRKRIALGTARGLAYLHDECNQKIIHRDVQAANILLDENFDAVVGDFGSAILMNHKDTHVTTTIPGKIGHIAPEYAASGRCSEKTDVYGYGLFILELITGKKVYELSWLALDENVSLSKWVKGILAEKKWEKLADVDAGGNNMEEVMEQLLQIAIISMQKSEVRRPKMLEIVRTLEGSNGLAERWEEWHKKEVFHQNIRSTSSPNVIVEDSFYMPSDELSGPR